MKKPIDFDPPEWIDREAWDGYIEMRQEKKKPPTLRACKMVCDKLEAMRDAGHNPNEVLDESTMNGWTGVFWPRTPPVQRRDSVIARLTGRADQPDFIDVDAREIKHALG